MNIPSEAVIGLLVIVILAVVLLALLRWRRLRIEPGRPSVPGDGKSALPVRVMLVNGFGMRRRPSTNMSVELDATAGTIKNVILPISSDVAEATLVPSREFGPVTVTAKAGRKKAKASVIFACDGGSIDVSATPQVIPAVEGSSSSVRIRIVDRNGVNIAPLRDTDIALKSTLGQIAGSVRIPARSSEAGVPITAAGKAGIAIISASADGLHGQGKVEFQTASRRFCMRCRAAVPVDATICPKCNLNPVTPGTEVVTCVNSSCGANLPDTADYCDKCGSPQPKKHT